MAKRDQGIRKQIALRVKQFASVREVHYDVEKRPIKGGGEKTVHIVFIKNRRLEAESLAQLYRRLADLFS